MSDFSGTPVRSQQQLYQSPTVTVAASLLYPIIEHSRLWDPSALEVALAGNSGMVFDFGPKHFTVTAPEVRRVVQAARRQGCHILPGIVGSSFVATLVNVERVMHLEATSREVADACDPFGHDNKENRHESKRRRRKHSNTPARSQRHLEDDLLASSGPRSQDMDRSRSPLLEIVD